MATTLTGGTLETIEAVLDGSVDLAGCSPDELVSARLRGADLVVVGGIISRPVSWVVGRPEIRSVEQLRGRRVGVNQTRGSVSMVMRGALRRVGLGLDAYEQVSVGSTPAMAQALRDGEVDAAMLTAPFDQHLLRDGFTGLLDVAELYPCYAFTTLNAQRAWVAAHDTELRAFFRATRAAGARIAAPHQQAASQDALAQATGLAAIPVS